MIGKEAILNLSFRDDSGDDEYSTKGRWASSKEWKVSIMTFFNF